MYMLSYHTIFDVCRLRVVNYAVLYTYMSTLSGSVIVIGWRRDPGSQPFTNQSALFYHRKYALDWSLQKGCNLMYLQETIMR